MENQTSFTTSLDVSAHENTTSSLTFATTTETTNLTDVKACLYATNLVESASLFQKYFSPCIIVVGLPGNLLSFLVWIRPRMLNSSGVYLVTLAIDHLSFLVLYIIYCLETEWGIRILSFPGLCEIFPVLYYFFQYMDPLLVSAFSVERYISIYHPFKRIKYCTKKRAIIVTLGLALFSALLSSVQGYFWYFEDNTCFIRIEVLVGGQSSVWQVWALITELLSFLVLPVFILVLNIRLLYYIRYKRGNDIGQSEVHHASKKSSAHTTVLLYVSFYFILTTFPVSVMYLLQLYFNVMNDCAVLLFYVSKIIVETIGHTHYALNFYIYLATGAVFREETKLLLKINKLRNPEVYAR